MIAEDDSLGSSSLRGEVGGVKRLKWDEGDVKERRRGEEEIESEVMSESRSNRRRRELEANCVSRSMMI